MSYDWKEFWAAVSVTSVIILLLMFPLLEIWALNTLFPTLEIPNWQWSTWFAVFVMNFAVGGLKFKWNK